MMQRNPKCEIRNEIFAILISRKRNSQAKLRKQNEIVKKSQVFQKIWQKIEFLRKKVNFKKNFLKKSNFFSRKVNFLKITSRVYFISPKSHKFCQIIAIFSRKNSEIKTKYFAKISSTCAKYETKFRGSKMRRNGLYETRNEILLHHYYFPSGCQFSFKSLHFASYAYSILAGLGEGFYTLPLIGSFPEKLSRKMNE